MRLKLLSESLNVGTATKYKDYKFVTYQYVDSLSSILISGDLNGKPTRLNIDWDGGIIGLESEVPINDSDIRKLVESIYEKIRDFKSTFGFKISRGI